MEWFKKEWLDSNAGTLGIYLALLYIRFTKLSKNVVKNDIRREINRLLSRDDRDRAWRSARDFIERVYLYYGDRNGFLTSDYLNFDLEDIERKYYESFKNACYRYLKYDLIKNYNKEVALLLREFKRNYIDRTSYGSIRSYNLFYKKDLEFIIKNTLINSGIMWFNEIIPAPYLENEFLERLERNEEIIVKNTIKEPGDKEEEIDRKSVV